MALGIVVVRQMLHVYVPVYLMFNPVVSHCFDYRLVEALSLPVILLVISRHS